jgi:hypothetical protein
MDIIEGSVVFRNLMGRAAFLRVKGQDDVEHQLYFRQEDLGEEGFARVRGVLLFEEVRVEVGPPMQLRTGTMARPAIRFVD